MHVQDNDTFITAVHFYHTWFSLLKRYKTRFQIIFNSNWPYEVDLRRRSEELVRGKHKFKYHIRMEIVLTTPCAKGV